MPEIKNTFLKSKMNKDLDDRLIPNGEYRDAQNLQISRSEGSSVGEFENIPGNSEVGNLLTGAGAEVIGQYTDDTNGLIYTISAGYSGAGNCPRDFVAFADGNQTGTTIALKNSSGTTIDPQAIGIANGMLLQGTSWNGSSPGVAPVITNVTTSNIVIDTSITVLNGDEIVIGFANSIHVYDVNAATILHTNPKLLVRGSFLNFHKDYKIFGINLLDDLLFWTDNRNQPRKINVTKANTALPPLVSPSYYTREDQISVAKYYPYKTPLVLTQNVHNCTSGAAAPTGFIGYELTMATTTGIQIGDIVSGFKNQGDQELWTVIRIAGTRIIIWNNFLNSPTSSVNGLDLTFCRPTMKNESSPTNENYFDTTVYLNTKPAWDPYTPVPVPGAYPVTINVGSNFTFKYNYTSTVDSNQDEPNPIPRVGDYITSDTFTGNIITDTSGNALTIADEVIIQSVDVIPLDNQSQNTYIGVTLNQRVRINSDTDQLRIAANPDYNSSFTGDEDLIEEKFVRFSYRFKYDDNEYSLSAPFTQICFIPKQYGQFGWGQSGARQDMDNTYASTIVEWFENRIDSVTLKIPLPDGGNTAATALTSLSNDYKVTSIDILYKESDALSTKIVKTIDVANITTSDIEAIPSNNTSQWYYKFDYKSVKPTKTLPTNQQNRVYDNVPIKALAQEISGNRVIYGNFIQKYTPPENLDYSVSSSNKSISYNNYCQYPNHSVKQNRNYQVGFVLADRYGRASSVVLSKYDDTPNTAGSTIYVPYKSWDDVQTTALSTYKWLGNSLNLTINSNSGISLTPTTDGQPGLYKAYFDSGVDELTIDDGGGGYSAGTTYTTVYDPGLGGTPVGLGSGLTVKVTSVAAGAITAVEIVNPGTGYVNNEIVRVVGGSNDGLLELTVYDANVTGWQSYKVVVKQQEQEYYNVYLPGFISGYPVTGNTDQARIAFFTLTSDNINKVPRDLNEIGPLQSEFSSSVKLFGRVNNPSPNNRNAATPDFYYSENVPYLWNNQYFPKRSKDEVTVVGPVGQGGLELANSPFSDANNAIGAFLNPPTTASTDGRLPWGLPGASQNFYNVEANPLAGGLRVGLKEKQPTLQVADSIKLLTLGAVVTTNAVEIPNPQPYAAPANLLFCMEPFLSVSETEPVESTLEIFYESSTSANLVELYKEL